jgi:hypothetical protein
VVATDDEVRAAVVLADDRVPHGLAGPAHPHRQVEQRQRGGVVRVGRQQQLVGPGAGVVVDVARLGQPDHRVDEQVGAALLGRPEGDLLVGPVHGVAGLEGHDLGPAHLLELVAHLGRGLAQRAEVVVVRQRQALEPT